MRLLQESVVNEKSMTIPSAWVGAVTWPKGLFIGDRYEHF
jgi:hypothetical protein